MKCVMSLCVCVHNKPKLKNGEEDRADILYDIVPRYLLYKSNSMYKC